MGNRKTYLTSYASRGYVPAQEHQRDAAMRNGIDQVFMYRREDIIRTDFYLQNKELFDVEIGGGGFLWKPFVVFDALNQIEDGAALVYSDCDMVVSAPLDPLVDICSRVGGVMLFMGNAQICRQANKRDTFVYMGLDSQDYWEAPHPWGGFSVWIKNEKSLKFVSEWLNLCTNKHLLLDTPNVYGKDNFPDFCCHAYDESILALLAARDKIELFRCPHPRCNSLKLPQFRVPGEDLFTAPDWPEQGRITAYSDKPMTNSPYANFIDWNSHPACYGEQEFTIHQIILYALRYHRDGGYKDIASARILYKRVLEFEPLNVEATYLLGLCYLQLRDYQRAIELFRAAISLKSDMKQAYLCLAYCYAELGDFISQQDYLAAVNRLEPAYASQHPRLDQSLFQLDSLKTHKVTVYLRGVNFDEEFYLRRNPDVAEAVRNGFPSGWEHFRRFGHSEGRASLPVEPPMLLSAPLDELSVSRKVEELCLNGIEARTQGNELLAMQLFHEARCLSPDNPKCILGYAQSRQELHDTDGAMREFSRLCLMHPTLPAAHAGRAELLLSLGLLHQSKETLECGVRFCGEQPEFESLKSQIESLLRAELVGAANFDDNNMGYSPDWSGGHFCPSPIPESDNPVRQFIEKMIPRGDGDCIEIGSYPGRYLPIFGELGYRLHGLDFVREVVETGKWLSSIGYRTGKFFYADFTSFVFPQRYDVVYSLGFIEHFKNWDEMILKHARIVKPGGTLIIGAPNFSGLLQRVLRLYFDGNSYADHYIPSMSPDHWKLLLELFGYEVDFAETIWGCDFPIGTEAMLETPDKARLFTLIQQTLPVLATFEPTNNFHMSYYLALTARRTTTVDIDEVATQPETKARIDEIIASAEAKNAELDRIAQHLVTLLESAFGPASQSEIQPLLQGMVLTH